MPGNAPRLSGRKLWVFRFLAALLVPFFCFGLLELVLRLTGFGHPTAFLLPARQAEQKVFLQNNQFGWRFFGREMARLPDAFCISQRKPADTIRIVVFGESAAKGEPQPAFGPARMLHALLSLRYPGTRFEVVNAAMTAINSHTVRTIARDCVRADANLWVIYMGNNEVVGPFGAGTVFGQQTPPLPFIRSTLALKTTRFGQLLDGVLAGLSSQPAEGGEWRGMKMFLDQQVRADDPRMDAVYHHFERNLGDIIQAGRRSGAEVVVCTVAVNLRDCAPFASGHRGNLTEVERGRWDEFFQRGIAAQAAGKPGEAAREFQAAGAIDDSFAELRYRQGVCALALGETQAAREHFLAARESDTLRFRCDGRLNALTRRSVTNREPEHVLLADVERAFAEHSRDGLPGEDLFYEHVHPTFQGNYLLAKTVAVQVERLLPAPVANRAKTPQPWPTEADCARRLGWTDWSRLAALQEILVRVKSPPFTGQVNHDAQLKSLTAVMEQLSPAFQPAGVSEARQACEAALAGSPDDPVLLGQLAYFKQMAGDLDGAAALARRELELLPSDSKTWHRLGLTLVGQQKLDEAAAAFQRAIELDPSDVLSMENLGQTLWLLGRHDVAIANCRRAVKTQPNFVIGWLSLGQVLQEAKRATEAEACFQKALACRTSRATDLVALARFCRSRNWQEAAVTNYDEAINLNPGDTKLRIEAGEFLLTLKRYADAERHFAESIRLAPDSARAHQLYGSVLGQQGMPVEAEQQFRETLRLAPDLLEARLNLGIALMSQGRSVEALSCIEYVLQRSPSNELALKYDRALRAKPTSESPR